MYKFTLLGGDHVDEKGHVYHRGDTITTYIDLNASFGDKFMLLEDDIKNKEVKTDPVKETSVRSMKLGKDVTKDYPLASDNSFLVLRKGSYFHVVDSDDQDTALNKKGLRKDAVLPFIEDLV